MHLRDDVLPLGIVVLCKGIEHLPDVLHEKTCPAEFPERGTVHKRSARDDKNDGESDRRGQRVVTGG